MTLKLTSRQRQAMEILATAERPLRNKDFHVRFEKDGRRTTGWAEALGPCTKEREHDENSLWCRGIVNVVDRIAYELTPLGRELAAHMGIAVATTIADDLQEIMSRKVERSTKKALIDARLGQGSFRLEVLKLWKNRCAVSGSLTLEAIRASHIKPWRDSTDAERLDPENGLPLIANLDALFDAGLISFSNDGKVIISTQLSTFECSLFAIAGCRLSKAPTGATTAYLEYHRRRRFRDDG